MLAPFFCPAARFATYPVRHRAPCLVPYRREACRDYPRTSTKDGDRLPRCRRRNLLDPLLLELSLAISSLQPSWRLSPGHVGSLEQGYEPFPCRGDLSYSQLPSTTTE